SWSRLGIPIGLAFLVRRGAADDVVAVLPGPAGPTEMPVAASAFATAWAALAAADPSLAELQPGVEALLVDRRDGARRCYRLSIDRCYALVGRLRARWRGSDGGDAVRAELRSYYEELEAHA